MTLRNYFWLSENAGVDLGAFPDLRPLKRRLITEEPDLVDSIMVKDLSAKLWAYVTRIASDDVAKSIDERLARAERAKARRERSERIDRGREERSKRPPAARDQPKPKPAPKEPEWTPYFHSADPDAKKPWMAKSKGQMTEDLVGAIEANRGMLPPDLQATIPNLVRFVRMRGGVKVAGLMENVYDARKGDISRLMWLFFGARYQDATDFVNSVLWQMEDTWNREDFPSADKPKPRAKKPAQPTPSAPAAPAQPEEAMPAPAAEPPAAPPPTPAQPAVPKKGLGPAGLMPQPAMPTTIIEKGTEAIPAVKPIEERPKPRKPKPDLFRQYKDPRLGK